MALAAADIPVVHMAGLAVGERAVYRRATMFAFLTSLFRRGPDPRDARRPLYDAVVAEARRPAWYREAAVPDTVDGRFEMVAALICLTLLRLEDEPGRQADMALLTEIFVEDMDGQLREFGVGDVVVGKRIGKMIGALGGRLGAYRTGFAEDGDARGAVVRNIYGGHAPDETASDRLIAGLHAFRTRLSSLDMQTILNGDIAAETTA